MDLRTNVTRNSFLLDSDFKEWLFRGRSEARNSFLLDSEIYSDRKLGVEIGSQFILA